VPPWGGVTSALFSSSALWIVIGIRTNGGPAPLLGIAVDACRNSVYREAGSNLARRRTDTCRPLPSRGLFTDMISADAKTTPIVLGSKPSAVIRLRGWERYAFLAFLSTTVVVGALAAAQLVGASVPSIVTSSAATLASIAAIIAFVGFWFAARRYDGESLEVPPSRSAGLIVRVRNRV
jgi:hypothetical protein